MKLASTSGHFKPIDPDNHIERIRHVAKGGFKYIDLSFYDIDFNNSPFILDGWQEYVNQLKDLAKELDIKFVQAHLPNCNPLDEEKFEEYLKVTIRSIEICGMLGIENAVIHVGWKDAISKEQFFEMNLKALEPLFPAMEKWNVNVLIENSAKSNMGDKYYFLTGADMKEFIEYANHPLIHACWDLGHANIEGHQYEDIIALGKNLKAIHVHDNNGIGDQHVALFSGTVNMDEVMTALIDSGYNGYFTFEADCAVSYGQTWQMNRHKFEKSTLLFDPTLEMFDAAERFHFEIGKACLKEYGIFED